MIYNSHLVSLLYLYVDFILDFATLFTNLFLKFSNFRLRGNCVQCMWSSL